MIRFAEHGQMGSGIAQVPAREGNFSSLFATADQKEGMGAFLGKRKAVFTRA